MTPGKLVAGNMKAIRLERKISQQDLSKSSKLSVRYITIRNTAPNVTLDVFKKMVS